MAEITDQLKTNWISTDFYNFEDLNRVEEATQLVSSKMTKFYGASLTLPLNLSRTELSIEFADSLNRVENNIEILRALTNRPNNTVEAKKDWTYNTSFSFSDANRLENNLYFLNKYLTLNLANIPYSGKYTVGQQGVF